MMPDLPGITLLPATQAKAPVLVVEYLQLHEPLSVVIVNSIFPVPEIDG